MKIGIFCNFSAPHQGGSERVIHEVAKRLNNRDDCSVSVYSFSTKLPEVIDKVNYIPCLKGYGCLDQINRHDHVLIYSDSFWVFETIVNNIDSIKPDVSVAMVGMYHMREHKDCFERFMKNIHRFRVITHSKYDDYKFCKKHKIKVNVIPNGIDIGEFSDNNVNFREKYNIKEKHILLNVASFFYGKGQDYLADIGKELAKTRDDFIIIQISNTISYPYAKRFKDQCMNKFQKAGFNYRFLTDIPREDVVGAFLDSDLFVFTSQKEVFPLVILEAMLARTPWVSMGVGNLDNQEGGLYIEGQKKDNKGYLLLGEREILRYVELINKLLNNPHLRRYLQEIGQGEILDLYKWDKIVNKYHKVFSR